MDRKVTSSTDAPGKAFPIVGIGASAGGLEALESFLRVLPKKFGVAIIFVQHLSAKHKNLLPELLRSRIADLTVNEIEDGMEITSRAALPLSAGKRDQGGRKASSRSPLAFTSTCTSPSMNSSSLLPKMPVSVPSP